MELVKYTLKVKESDDGKAKAAKEVTDTFKVSSVCGWYTLDSAGKYCEDKKYVKYLHMPEDMNVNFDLTKSHADDVHKSQEKMKESIEELLRWISTHSKGENGKPKLYVCI